MHGGEAPGGHNPEGSHLLPPAAAEQIDAEILEGTGADPRSFLNNFSQYLPTAPMRQTVANLGWLERKFVDATRQGPSPLNSQRSVQVSWLSFFKDFDESLRNAGISAEEAAQMQDVQASQELTEVVLRGRQARLIPVYRDMRLRGYSHHDLIV